MPTIAVPGGSLFTSTSGEPGQPTAVLVHSGIAHSQMWAPLMEALRGELFAVAYDCRCFGRSTTTLDGQYSDIADLASIFDAFGLESALLVGDSRGGRIAIDFALTHPQRVRGLFLIAADISGFDTPVTDAERTLLDAIEAADRANSIEDIIANEAKLLVDGPTRGPAPERKALRTWVAQMSRVNYALQQNPPDFTALDPSAAGRLREIQCPVHILVGEADTSGMRAKAAALERDCPHATLVQIPDAAHMLTLEYPDVVEHELRSWLQKAAGQP